MIRLRLAVRLLRGHPVAYRLLIDEGSLVCRDHTSIVECTIRGVAIRPTVSRTQVADHPAIRVIL